MYLASWSLLSWSFIWALFAALLLGLLLFFLGYLLGWSLWKDRRVRVEQAPRANESLKADITRLEADVRKLEA